VPTLGRAAAAAAAIITDDDSRERRRAGAERARLWVCTAALLQVGGREGVYS
jgi:hypothetical protein